MSGHKAIVTALLSASGIALAFPAAAQESQASQPPQADPGSGLGDIVVTARKREESLQNVPVAITAFGGEALREKNIDTFYDVPLHTPGLTVRTASAERSGADFFIRGQGSTYGSGPGVVSYFSDVPAFGSLLGNNIQFYDLASVQVLKGPQGTLFGRSTTGGAVLIEPARPTADFGGFVEVKAGNYDMREVTGALNVPLVGDVLMLRVAGNIVRRDGFTISSTTGQKLDDRRRESYRVGLLFRPSESFENYTLFYGEHINENASGSVLLEFNDTSIAQFAAPSNLVIAGFCANPAVAIAANCAGTAAIRAARLDALHAALNAEEARIKGGGSIRQTPTAYQDFLRGSSQVLQNTTTIRPGEVPVLGDLMIKNIFATGRTIKAASTREIGGSPLPHGQPINGQELIGGVPTITNRSGTTKFFDHFTEEVQLGGGSPTVDWLVGYFVEVDKNPLSFPPIFPAFNNAFSIPLDALAYQGQLVLNQKDIDRGLFGQATVKLDSLIGGLSVTAGYRKSKSTRRSFNAPAVVTPTGVVPGVVVPGVGLKEKVSSYNFSVDYRAASNLLLYAATRKGYKPGGVNPPPAEPIPGALTSFRPEILKDVELGAKYDWESGVVSGRTNIALYKQWYSDIQRNQILINPNPPFGTVTQVANIARASIKGLELENVIQVGRRLTFTLNYSFTDAKYTRYPGTTTDILGNVIPNVEAPYVGTPKHQGTLGIRFLAVESDNVGNVSISGDLYRQSRVWLDDQALQDPEQVGKQKAWSNLNLRLDWNNAGGTGIDAGLFARNVTKNVHLLGVGNLINNLGVITGIYSEPRTWGIELRYKFGS
ncbi:iron complex outermembrane receptor protein [Sphingobium wenxiniae]|uniref:TonB-denpendent receptor n=2 Tax=Sphingobium TaxID=165695 RepID=T0HHA1_9SPHN|nr:MULTISPECIES: TonB-dependent receptor [Sphingobium]EQA96928.1 hypothetical protein L485_22900 [Sphingobium baderi LL03]KMS64106.1 hypothetical protein V475_19905 [Sphingobium baderi LL03]MBB6191107.1 iron complex outermembrane receptor protein [Sphingobium wenxiniae]TWH96093.1 iron complex outermembrane receptor protein [Sphingobium wenxiniae]